MRVLVTGGAGYVGTELIYALSEKSEVTEIVVLDNLSRGNFNVFIGVHKLNSKVRFVNGDILDTRLLRSVLKNIDVVYHLAAKVTTPFADQNPHFFEQTNNWGTAELVYAVEEADIKRFIYLSSVSVYGASSEEVDTDSPDNPKTFYGISKMRGEAHVKRLSTRLPTYVLRCGNVYGYSKSMRFDAVINKFMFDANFKKRITINGDGEQHRSFVHIDYLSSILARLTGDTLQPGRYDIVEKVLRINDIADTVKGVYPEMEMLYVNQHLHLREIKVRMEESVNALCQLPFRTLSEELADFKGRFTF